MNKIVTCTLLCVSLLMLVIPTITMAQNDDAALRQIIEAVRIGWLDGDGTAFREHFLDFEGARYFEGGGQNAGLTDLIEHHIEPEANAFKHFSLEYGNIETHIENGFAWALVDFEFRATLKSDHRLIHHKGHATYLFRNVDSKWKVVHTSSASRAVKE